MQFNWKNMNRSQGKKNYLGIQVLECYHRYSTDSKVQLNDTHTEHWGKGEEKETKEKETHDGQIVKWIVGKGEMFSTETSLQGDLYTLHLPMLHLLEHHPCAICYIYTNYEKMFR